MPFAIQFTRNGVDIPGAIGDTYHANPDPAVDGNKTIFGRVVATGLGGSTAATTNPGVFIPATGALLAISGTPPPTGIVGQFYDFTPTITGGTPPYVCSISPGSLPGGAGVTVPTGRLSGTLTTAQIKSGIGLKVVDHVGATQTLQPLFSITVAASGTAVTPATWRAALAAAAPGAVLTMAPGDYGTMNLFSVSKAAPGVLLQGQAGVHATAIACDTCAGLTFKAIATTGFLSGTAAYAVNSDRIVFDTLSINGGSPGVVHTGTGIFFRSSTNVTANNCDIVQVATGVLFATVTGLTVTNNSVSQYSSNAYFGTNPVNALFGENYGANLDFLTPGDHPDFIQIGLGGSNITLRNNNYDRAGGVACQGSEIEFVTGLVIDGYAAFGCQTNGVFTNQCVNVTFRNIFVQGYDYSPQIYFRNGTDNITISGCFAAGVPFSGGFVPPEAANTNYHIGVNTLIPNATSASDRARYLAFLQSNPSIPTS